LYRRIPLEFYDKLLMSNGQQEKEFRVIEYHMLNKRLFFPLAAMGSLCVHTVVYPFQVVRTRLQLQQGRTVYTGLFNAYQSIYHCEGVRGLYSGFIVKSTQHIAGMSYILTYENVRYRLSDLGPVVSNNSVRSFLAGTCASSVAQVFMVPFDVVSQHLMVLNTGRDPNTRLDLPSRRSAHVQCPTSRLTPLRLSDKDMRSAWSKTRAIISHLYREHGFVRGFYHGFFMSLLTFGPSNGLWWMFYTQYCDLLSQAFGTCDVTLPRMLIQQMAAPLAGCTNSIITNPLDVVRVRMQVEQTNFIPTIKRLWKEERFAMLHKGLLARIAQSTIYSTCVILFYEQVKLFTLKPEYVTVFRPSAF
jgi:solute carrier family 25, member 44